MAALTIRRPWARGILALLIASAVLFIGTPSTKKTPSLAQVGDPLPPGAAACQVVYTRIKAPFDAGARGTPLTTCRFVEQVRREAYTQHFTTLSPPTELHVASPTSRKWYAMQCVSEGSYVTCGGGMDAIVYLYTAR